MCSVCRFQPTVASSWRSTSQCTHLVLAVIPRPCRKNQENSHAVTVVSYVLAISKGQSEVTILIACVAFRTTLTSRIPLLTAIIQLMPAARPHASKETPSVHETRIAFANP